ncbi:MAG: hypothetical protein F6J87_28765 [Spirulina sp. SIO3F2]|nr:hypothetical protein [Spirulina sp. SIO3F2]
MKSKIRKIVVENLDFKWNVKHLSPDYIALRLWFQENRALPWAQVRVRFDNPWLHYGELLVCVDRGIDVQNVFQLEPMTPKRVRSIIQQIIDLNGQPTTFRNSLNYALADDGALVPTSSALSVT